MLTPQGATYEFAKFSQKLHEIERISIPRGCASLTTPWIHHCTQIQCSKTTFADGKKDGCQMQPHRFHVSQPPPLCLATGSAMEGGSLFRGYVALSHRGAVWGCASLRKIMIRLDHKDQLKTSHLRLNAKPINLGAV